jgi:hypothetical protein
MSFRTMAIAGRGGPPATPAIKCFAWEAVSGIVTGFVFEKTQDFGRCYRRGKSINYVMNAFAADGMSKEAVRAPGAQISHVGKREITLLLVKLLLLAI